jgi:hypothetical protein
MKKYFFLGMLTAFLQKILQQFNAHKWTHLFYDTNFISELKFYIESLNLTHKKSLIIW